MSRRIVKLPAFAGVAVSSRATLLLPVGARKYHRIIIQYKAAADNQATIEGALTTMRILVNGRVQREATVAQINVLRAYRGRAFQTGFVFVDFSEPAARTLQGEELNGWGTNNLSTLTLELDISGAAVAPALVAWAEIEDSTEGLGGILKWRKNTYIVAGAGVLAIRDLPRDPREAYSRFHAFTVQATEVQLKADNDVIIETISRTALAAHYANRPQQTVMQANVLSLDITASTQLTDFLPMLRTDGRIVQDMPLEITLGAAATFDLLSEVFGPAL